MRENNFEKKVRDRMEQLQLRPSGEVWDSVEKRIREKKKRRMLIWWPLGILLLGGGLLTTYLLSGKSHNPVARQRLKNTSGHEEIRLPQQQNHVSSSVTEKNKTGLSPVQQTIAPARVKGAVAAYPGSISSSKSAGSSLASGSGKKSRKAKAKNNREETEDIMTTAVTETTPPDTGGETRIAEKIEVARRSPWFDIMPSTKDNAAITLNKNPGPADSTQQSPAREQVKKRKKWAWEKGLMFSGGLSNLSEGLIRFNNLVYADAANQSAQGPVIVSNHARVRQGISWGAGFYARHTLSKKWDVEAGLGYQLLTTRFRAGTYINSPRVISNYNMDPLAVNGFYSPAAAGGKDYVNHYHFVLASLGISWKCISWKKKAISWDNGLSYARLVATDMLHFDPSIPGYYRDNRLPARNQFLLNSSLRVPVSKHLNVSPYVMYGLTRLLKRNDGTPSHYSGFDFRLQYRLNK